ncbi:glycosyltransferase family 2 protein [Pikeienuella piscinae]|nr:glycosyltransferase family 2 protein [Pikeienuella piscinae]
MNAPENDASRCCGAAPVCGAGLPEAERIWRLGPGGSAAPAGWSFALGPDDALAPGAGPLIEGAPDDVDVVIADDLTRGRADALRLKPCHDPLLLERIDYAGRAVFFRASALGAEARSALEGGAAPSGLIRPDHRVAHLPYPAAILAPTDAAPAPPPLRSALGPVAAIIPNRDSPRLIRAALQAVLDETEEPAPVAVVIDNGSTDPETLTLYESIRANPRIRIEMNPAPFNFAAMVNRGAALARAEFSEVAAFLLLNNDIEAPAPDWLRPMAETLAAPGVGVVGAKLLFADRTIQHAGVIVGHGGVAGHDLKSAPEDAPGLCGRMAAPHLREAVTAAAMLIRTEVWDTLGGFDASAFPVAFNDVDFCLRAGAAGWRVALEPRAALIHHEGVSRRRPFSLTRFVKHQRERTMLRFRHHTIGRIDRFESPWRDPERLTPVFRMLKNLPPMRF